jgi:hypothetical protein
MLMQTMEELAADMKIDRLEELIYALFQLS